MLVLKQYRYLKKKTIADMARSLGVSVSSYHRWENGETRPSFAAIDKIAKLLGKEPQEIVRTVHPEVFAAK